jgi:type IV pilus assembly protein PilV
MAERRSRARGFTLIEVLVALVVVSIGLLGLVGLHTRMQQAEYEAYNRAQALVLLDAIVDRINANRATAQCYAVTANDGTGLPYVGVADGGHAPAFTCSGFGDVNTQTRAVADLGEWDAALRGAAEAQGGNAIGGALNARGCVTYDAVTDVYTVAVAWQGLFETAAPAHPCGTNRYGSEARRRVVWATFRIATLL